MPPSTVSSRNSTRPPPWRTTSVLSEVASAESVGDQPAAGAHERVRRGGAGGAIRAPARGRQEHEPPHGRNASVQLRPPSLVSITVPSESASSSASGPVALNLYGSPGTSPAGSHLPPPSRERCTVPSFSAR